jgi:geranylgeranyl reductase family protein
MEKYDVVIVGAGPAGLQAAKVLAESGKKVIVFEKNKTVGDKVCAGGLTRKDLQFGIPREITEKQFTKVRLHTDQQTLEIKREHPIIYTIDRKKLGKWQLQEAKDAGAEIALNTPVKQIKDNSVVLEKDEVGFDHLIGADGASSLLRKSLRIKTDELLVTLQYIINNSMDKLEIYLDPPRFGMTYVWIFPHSNTTSVGSGIDVGRTIPIDKLRKEFLGWCQENAFDISKARFESAPINYDYEGHEFENKYLVGDAGGFASGLTGEGIYSAMLSGEEIAKKIIDPTYDTPRLSAWLKFKKWHDSLYRLLEFNTVSSEALIEVALLILRCDLLQDIAIRFAGG